VNLLALDTSSVACSVAVQIGGEVTARHEERPREHTRILVPMIRETLADSGAELAEMDAIVLGNGPGSFIGMRIAASVAQGMAFASSLQIVPVSSMAAVAARAMSEEGAGEVVVAQDAHMQQVYLGIYRPGEKSLPQDRVPERLHGLTAIEDLAAGDASNRVAAGYGWHHYPELLAANRDRIAAVSDIMHPHAADLLPLGAAALDRGGAVAPQAVVPAYLRQKVAEKPS
jgi:tRNA threonylcarbamoyladenosine biosynthesis protein TsaB